jgi:hypothetical protein
MVLLDRELAPEVNKEHAQTKIRYNTYVIVTWIIAFSWAMLLSMGNESSFIYFQF